MKGHFEYVDVGLIVLRQLPRVAAEAKAPGDKATTGEKLSKCVVEIYNAAHGGSMTCKEEAVAAKKEPKLKKEPIVKAETPSTGKRKLKKEDSDSSCGPILSPRRLQSLYSMPVSIKELFSL